MDFNERVIPGVSSNYMMQEELSKYEFAKKYIKRGMKVVDLGCGTGYGTAILGNAVGIDIDKEAVTFAKKNYDRKAKFEIRDITETKFKDKSFDLAVSFEVVEHLANPDKFLKEVKRITKPRSYFILSTPNTKKSKYGSPYHKKEYEYDELLKLLRKYYKKVNIYGQFHSKSTYLAWKEFLKSQKTRQSIVNKDKLAVRKLIPKKYKEFVWKYIGNFFGRSAQDLLTTKDFPIQSKNARTAYNFIAVCEK